MLSLLHPGQRIGNYVIEELIGSGGMGEVWRGRHELLARPVAIKSIAMHLASDPEFADRFQLEAKAQAALAHRHIVAVTDFFSVAEGHFLVMPLIAGESLQSKLEGQRPLSLAEASVIAFDILGALEYAHGRGVIHRDVKPSNIILDAQGRGHLTDFGIAIMAGHRRLTQTGAAIGTPHYMSPEQILRPRKLDHRTDIYSAGCVLFEMLAGRPPFDAHTEGADADYVVKDAHLRTPPPSLRAHNPDLPEEVEQVVRKALAKQPDERFQSCAEMATALTAAVLDPIGTAATIAIPAVRSVRPPAASALAETAAQAPPANEASPLSIPPLPSPPPVSATRRSGLRANPVALAAVALLTTLGLVVLAILIRPRGSPTTITVEPRGGEARTIAAALARVKEGGTVFLRPGVYRESVRLEHDVEIVGVGEGSAVVIEGTSAPTLSVVAGRQTLRNLAVHQPEPTAASPVVVVLAGRLHAEDCTISGEGPALVSIADQAVGNLRRCRLEGASSGAGIAVEGGGRGLFENGTITRPANAVLVLPGAEVTLRTSELIGCQLAGVRVQGTGFAAVDRCTVRGCVQTGVDVSGGGRLLMRGGSVLNGQGLGVLVHDRGEAIIEGVELAENASHGVEARAGFVTLRECTIRDNAGRGVWARDGATILVEKVTFNANARGAMLADRTSRIQRQ